MKRKKLPDWCMATGCNPWQREELDCCQKCDLKKSDGIIDQKDNDGELGLF